MLQEFLNERMHATVSLLGIQHKGYFLIRGQLTQRRMPPFTALAKTTIFFAKHQNPPLNVKKTNLQKRLLDVLQIQNDWLTWRLLLLLVWKISAIGTLQEVAWKIWQDMKRCERYDKIWRGEMTKHYKLRWNPIIRLFSHLQDISEVWQRAF